ncbi:MAG: endonuclease III [Leptonema sp. (in: bacteria)]
MQKSSNDEELKFYALQIFNQLKDAYGIPKSPLKYKEPYQFCISVILSAQCTDEKVNQVTPILFEKYPTIESLAKASLSKIEKIIFPTGFYKTKAKKIKEFCKILINKYNKQIPNTMDELLKLPGVGRKTANVILQELYKVPSGIVVDTHVKRLSNVLQLTKEKKPEKIEQDLMKILPKECWISFSLYLIFLGRSYCTAKKRNCSICILNQICKSAFI